MANALTKVTGNVIDSTTNITAGIITATSFVGSGANLTGVASTDNIRTNTNATFLQNINVTGIVTTAGVNASGVITATSFSGSGANLTGVASTDNIRTNTNATFLQNINVTGIVTASGANVSGVSTFTTVKVGTAATIDSSGVQVGAGKSIRLYGATSGFSDIIAAAGSASTIFTLPANGGTAGQFLQTDGSGALSFASAGKILQVVQTSKSNVFTTQSTTFVDVTGMSASITPASASNKILVMAMFMGITDSSYVANYKMLVGSSDLFVGDTDGNRTRANAAIQASGAQMDYINPTMPFIYLHSPASISTQTYKLQAKVNGGTLRFNSTSAHNTATAISGSSSIVLMEVAG